MISSPASTPSKSRKNSKTVASPDRFIPCRRALDVDLANFSLHRDIDAENMTPNGSSPSSTTNVVSPAKEVYKLKLADTLLANSPNRSILSFSPSKGSPMAPISFSPQRRWDKDERRPKTRHIPHSPDQVLDAPDLKDDYYLNLLDWSCKNLLAVALGNTVYLWNGETGIVTELMSTQSADDYITSVSWMERGEWLAVGTSQGELQLWDVAALKLARSPMKGHRARIASLSCNKWIISSGSRDSTIMHHDPRASSHIVSTLQTHTQEVCGLKWSQNGQQLASGGNDNLLCIWDEGQQRPRFQLDYHKAAVKALAWSPFQSTCLASGGGTADRRICIWNTATGACLQEKDTNSQVCSLQWSRHSKELLSSHGFTHNQLCLWSYPSMTKVTELTGHGARVLHMAQSPDGGTVVSAAADETLRFWRVFETGSSLASLKGGGHSRTSSLSMLIR